MTDKDKSIKQLEEDGWKSPESKEFAEMQNKLQKEMDDRMTNPSEIPTESSEKKREPLKRHLGYHRNLIFVPHWYHAMLIGILCLCLGVVAYSKTTEVHKESTQTVIYISFAILLRAFITLYSCFVKPANSSM